MVNPSERINPPHYYSFWDLKFDIRDEEYCNKIQKRHTIKYESQYLKKMGEHYQKILNN